jgi:1,2-diacylglycerol 3-beta-galactosyltransferase
MAWEGEYLMADPKRILILTADAGFGHRSAANAISAALQEEYGERCRVEIANPLDDKRTPAVLRDSQMDYDRLVREMPDVYKLRYEISDAPVSTAIMESVVTVMLFRVMQDILRQSSPDVILVTHPMCLAPLHAALAVEKLDVPFFTVITDLLSVHRMWFHSAADLILAPNETVRKQALELDILAEKVQVTGIPVNPAFVREQRSPAQIRQELGWHPHQTTALIVGSKRVKHLEEVLHVLNHSWFPIQLVVVAGGDDERYEKLQDMEWHAPVHLYNFVESMPTLMCAADLMVCKAGGLIVTESLACGLPMLIIDVTPGQEEGNAEYVVKNGAADLAESPLQALEHLCHWLIEDQVLLRERAEAARGLGFPRAAYTIADYIWAAAERPPKTMLENRQAILPRLLELLESFGIAGDNPSSREKPKTA